MLRRTPCFLPRRVNRQNHNQAHNRLCKACFDLLTLNRALVWSNQGSATPAAVRDGQIVYRAGKLCNCGRTDLEALMPGGQFLAVEVKTGSGRLTPDQEATAQAIRERGGAFVRVLDTVDALSDWLHDWRQGRIDDWRKGRRVRRTA